MKSKVNANTVLKMREQYKYAKQAMGHSTSMMTILEYETVLWERHMDVSLRGEDTKKGVLPDVVDFLLYKRVKEAWIARLAQEKGGDGGTKPI